MNLISILKKAVGTVRSKNARKVNPNPPLSTPAYLNRYSGRTFLVLGNGPSLKTYRKEIYEVIDKHDPIVMGANHITGFIYPHYHAFTNRKRLLEYGGTIDSTKSKVLLAPYLTDELINQCYCGQFEYLMYLNDNDALFDIQEGIIQAGCRTVSVLLIGIAIVMGASRIFVAGLDGYFFNNVEEPNRYYTQTSVLSRNDELMRVQAFCTRALSEIDMYMKQHDIEPFKIITPTAYANHYCDIDMFL